MKRLIHIIMCLAMLSAMPAASARNEAKEQQKAQQEHVKQLKKQIGAKPVKEARKEAKRLAKEGWRVSPGALPADKQLEKSYMLQFETDENGYPLYIMAEAMSVGENYDAAKMQATELAKQNLIAQVETNVNTIIENDVSNQQLSAEEAASITRSVLASKNVIAAKLGRILPVVQLYRTLPNKNTEVLVRIAYNSELARQAAIQAVRDDLESRGDKLHLQLDSLLIGK